MLLAFTNATPALAFATNFPAVPGGLGGTLGPPWGPQGGWSDEHSF